MPLATSPGRSTRSHVTHVSFASFRLSLRIVLRIVRDDRFDRVARVAPTSCHASAVRLASPSSRSKLFAAPRAADFAADIYAPQQPTQRSQPTSSICETDFAARTMSDPDDINLVSAGEAPSPLVGRAQPERAEGPPPRTRLGVNAAGKERHGSQAAASAAAAAANSPAGNPSLQAAAAPPPAPQGDAGASAAPPAPVEPAPSSSQQSG
jgi:hypothetical protein